MMPWGVIGYGAALSAVVAVLLALIAKERHLAVLVGIALGTAGGPVAWNAILRTTQADQFFTDAPL